MAKLVDHAVTMGEIGGRRLCHAVDLAADGREAFLHADDDALNLFGALAGALGARGDIVALADQIADLAVKVANGIADQMGGLPRRFGKAFHFAGDHRKAFACLAGARCFDGRIQRQQIGLLGDRLDRSGHLRNLRQGASDSAQSGFDAADRFDQFGDVLDRGVHRDARLGDFTDGRGGSRLHRLRCVGDVVIGGDHRLCGLLQMSEALGLGGYAMGDFLHIAGDVGELDPEAADLVRKLIDQPLARRGGGCCRLQVCSLEVCSLEVCRLEVCKLGVHSLYAVRKPPQCRPLTRIGTSISRIMMVLPLPMSRA